MLDPSAKLAFLARTNELLRKVDLPAAERMDADVLNQLEVLNLIQIPLILKEFGIDWSTSLADRRRILKIPSFSQSPALRRIDAKLYDWCVKSASAQRRQSWIWRVGEEAAARDAANWYPFFVTLTVDPKVYDARTVMGDGIEWNRYRERVSEIARRCVGVSQSAPVGSYFRSVGVVEHGKSRAHHHIHALLWLAGIPDSWTIDPNFGRVLPNATDVLPLKAVWPWGSVTKAEAFRYASDIWSRDLGWRWSMPNGQPRRALPVFASGAYLFKYLQKESKEWKHRVKSSRGLGLSRLWKWLNTLAPMSLLLLSLPPMTREQLTLSVNCGVPSSLMRQQARRMLMRKLWASPSLRSRLMMMYQMRNYSGYQKMLVSVGNGARPWSMDLEELQDWRLCTLLSLVGAASYEAVDQVWSWAADAFPLQDGEAIATLAGVRNK